MPVDLHIHTTASDGLYTPSEVVRASVELGLAAVGITDHDSVAGVSEALSEAEGTKLRVIPGVELSIVAPDGADAHVLGYFVDHASERLASTLRSLREGRAERARLMVQLLRDAGYPLEYERVADHALGGAVGRVHIARALVDAGTADSVEAAFRRLIGRSSPYYVNKSTLSAGDAVDAIHAAGGVAVLAHPGVSGESALGPLLDAGLDGIEAFHAEHSPEQRRYFSDVAAREGLVVSGGSDFHGPNLRSSLLGQCECPDEIVDALWARAQEVRS